MRKRVAPLIAAVMLGGLTAVALSTPAQADPCGASSWKPDVNTQAVGYRNCSSGSVRFYGWINIPMSSPGSCVTIGGGRSATLVVVPTFRTTLVSWGVAGC